MRIDKAIEILEETRNINFNYYNPDRRDALQLGIEALKRVKQCRHAPYGRLEDILLGETET